MREKYTEELFFIYFGLVFFSLLFLVGDKVTRKEKNQPVFLVDTVIQKQIDTVRIQKTRIKYNYERQIDTIYLLDSVGIDSAYTSTIKRLSSLEKAGFFER